MKNSLQDCSSTLLISLHNSRSVHYKAATDDNDFSEPQESSISVVASLRSADATVYRHDSSNLEIPTISASLRNDLAHLSVQHLDVKVRQGFKVFCSMSLEDIEGHVNLQEIQTLATSVDQWLHKANGLLSAVQTISKRRICKSRNLVAAIVLAGDKCEVSNDPPFLTRPSHVLRISKNLLRVNDSWKISARVRHIARSLPLEDKDEIERHFESSASCGLVSMGPVLQILSRWRSWEMSNIQDSFFFKWLSGETDKILKAETTIPIEGVMVLGNAVLHVDTIDGKDNLIRFHNIVVSSTEQREPSPTIRATKVVGIDISCEGIFMTAESDAIDLLNIISRQQFNRDTRKHTGTVEEIPSISSASMIEYRCTVLISQVDVSGQLATLGLSLGTQDLRVSAFAHLRRDQEFESPSFTLSFHRMDLAALESLELAAHLNMEHFSAQMLSLNQRLGVAGSLGLIALRLAKPLPWLIKRASDIVNWVKNNLDVTPDAVVPPSPTFQKPNLPTITFRLHQASIEMWLVPGVLLLNLSSDGLQAVLGELSDSQQWIFLDVPPATISLHRAIAMNVKLAEVLTPFIAVKTLIQWEEDFCKLDSTTQVGTLSLTMTSLVTLFKILATEEVVSHLADCQKAIEDVQKCLEEPVSVNTVDPKNVYVTIPVSYRVRSQWDSVQVMANTPETNILFACSDIYISLSNRSAKPNQSQRILFTAGSQNTSLSLLSHHNIDDKLSLLDMHWEVGNSVTAGNDGNVLYRLYLISNAFVITLSPRSMSQASQAISHIVQEVEKLEIRQTLRDLNLGNDGTEPAENQIEPVEVVNTDEDPFEALKSIDAVRVSFSDAKFKWIASDNVDDSHGFTFKCKTVDASVLDRVTKGRFSVREGEIELNCPKTKVSSNYARLPKLDFSVQRRTETDGWQLQLDAHGDTVQVNITPACIETGHAVLESISMAAADLRTEFPSDNSTTSVTPLTSQVILKQTKMLKAVVTSIDFSGARINAQYDRGFKPTAYMSKYRVKGDGCDVGAMHIPGLALRSRFLRKPCHVFHAEICILESTNILSPQIKPFIHDLLHRIESVMSRRGAVFTDTSSPAAHDSAPGTAAILGDLKFSVGLRVQSQELTLTCDPFSKVDAKVGIDEIYATLTSCKTANHNQTFAMTVTMSGAHLSLQHQYSGIASAKVKLQDLCLSMFNNNQIRSAEPGISAILKSSAFQVSLNARQGISRKIPTNVEGQDFLIFNSLWLEGAPVDPAEELRQKRLSSSISMQQLQKVTASPPYISNQCHSNC